MLLYFILGIIVGLLISVINLIIIKKDIPNTLTAKVERIFKNNKAVIVDTRDPLDIDLNE